MGNAQGNFKHDPGAKGESGEGDSTVVLLCLTYVAAAAVLAYKRWEAQRDEGKVQEAQATARAEDAAKSGEEGKEGKSADDINDEVAQKQWTQPEKEWQLSEESRTLFCKIFSFGIADGKGEGCLNTTLWAASGFNFLKIALLGALLLVLWIFLLSLSLMGTGFKLLGGKDAAGMFDVVDNPISGLMVGILATVLVQSSSTSTSIIITLVGADELSVSNAVPMIMGANIGTSVTNTLVALGHFANPNDLRRGFAAATVHDLFNLLSVSILLPLNWATTFLEEMTGAMAGDAKACNDETSDCESQDFIKPYIKPYVKGVASYDKKVAKYVAEGYCDGMCDGVTDSPASDYMKSITAIVCKKDGDDYDCSDVTGYKKSWFSSNELKKKRAPLYVKTGASITDPAEYLLACPTGSDCSGAANLFDATTGAVSLAPNTVYTACEHFKTGLCDKRLLKGGLMLDDWELSDEGAGSLSVILSVSAICCCLYLIVMTLQFLIKGLAARLLQKALALNGYVSMLIGLFITLMVQSSSITTATMTPLCAVGLISLEQMYPITLGANIGTTLTGIMAASVVTSNPKSAWQVALCHLFFNIFGILIWYPIPKMREIPLNGARALGRLTATYGVKLPIAYTATVFFIIPAICYGIAVAATS